MGLVWRSRTSLVGQLIGLVRLVRVLRPSYSTGRATQWRKNTTSGTTAT